MTKKEIQEQVDRIKTLANDDEAAHSMEDGLYAGFVEYVASLGGDLGKKAKIVLQTKDIEFSRWAA